MVVPCISGTVVVRRDIRHTVSKVHDGVDVDVERESDIPRNRAGQKDGSSSPGPGSPTHTQDRVGEWTTRKAAHGRQASSPWQPVVSPERFPLHCLTS
jgi:hypothetical protein